MWLWAISDLHPELSPQWRLPRQRPEFDVFVVAARRFLPSDALAREETTIAFPRSPAFEAKGDVG
jgi:hypothetical protein